MSVNRKFLVYALPVWGGMVLAAMANGAFREIVLTRLLNEAAARALSSVTLCLLIFITIDAFIARCSGPFFPGELLALGAFWTTLGILFEFALGLGMMKLPLSALLQDYNIFAGRLLILVWLTTLLGPWVAGRRRRKRR